MGIRRTALTGTIIGLAVPTAAFAGAVLDLPAIDAVHTYSATNKLTLSWHLDDNPGTVAKEVTLADDPARDASGAFLSTIDSQLSPGTSWKPTVPLWAGQYWWLVETNDPGAARFSTLGRFTEATVLRYSKWRVYHDRKHGNRLALALSYTTNAPRIKITLRLYNAKGKQLVAPIVRNDDPHGPNVPANPTNINWLPKTKIARGTPLRIRITIQAGVGPTARSVTQTTTTRAS